MKLLALTPLLLVALTCTPVYGVWVYNEGTNYFAMAAMEGSSTAEWASGRRMPSNPTKPAANSDRTLQRYPNAVGARCTPDQLRVIADNWNTAIKIFHLADAHHARQMRGTTFVPNASFRNFIASGNHRVLAAGPNDPQTLFDTLSATIANVKRKLASPGPTAADPTATGMELTVTCYQHLWNFDTRINDFKDHCVAGGASVSQAYHTLAAGGVAVYPVVNFCPGFFTQLNPWHTVFNDMRMEFELGTVDGMQLTQLMVMVHEWMHVNGIVWKIAKDLAYKAANCRKLTRIHEVLTAGKGGGAISSAMTPGNADSLALYFISSALDTMIEVRKYWGTALDPLRTSSADPDPEHEQNVQPHFAVAVRPEVARYAAYWDSMDWATQLSTGGVLVPMPN